MEIFSEANLINDAFNIRNGGLIMNQSLQTTIDEIKSSARKCSLSEFIEAFFRAGEALSYPPPEEVIVYTGEEFTYNPSLAKYKEQFLIDKVENIIKTIFHQCCTRKFKDTWIWPKKDAGKGLYIKRTVVLGKMQKRKIINLKFKRGKNLLKIASSSLLGGPMSPRKREYDSSGPASPSSALKSLKALSPLKRQDSVKPSLNLNSLLKKTRKSDVYDSS